MNRSDPGRFFTKHVVTVIAVTVTVLLLWFSPNALAALTVLHSFTGGADGAVPFASLTLSGSTLYGTTYGGDPYYLDDLGTIFKINTDGTGYQVLHNFTGGTDGVEPVGSLTLSGATLYGTTCGGTGNSTVFKINTDGSGYHILHSFTGGTDGYDPNASLTVSVSTLYGKTETDRTTGNGTVFKINTDGSGYQILYNFTGGTDGYDPNASLTLSGSTLYGTTTYGGNAGCGTVFRINTDGSGYQIR